MFLLQLSFIKIFLLSKTSNISFAAGEKEWTKKNLQASTNYAVSIAEAAGTTGYGMETLLNSTIKTGFIFEITHSRLEYEFITTTIQID